MSHLDAAAIALARMDQGLPVVPTVEMSSQRRWESTQLTRLNAAQWSDAQGQSINADLRMNLERLRAQVELEYERNSMLKGVVETHAADLIGPDGPSLNIQSDNPAFDTWAEERWAEFWAAPEITGKLCGPDLLKLWIRGMWKAGELLGVKVNATQRQGMRMRLRAIHPRRLVVPATGYQDNVVMGVELDENDRPTHYHIDLQRSSDIDYVPGLRPDRLHESRVLHEFIITEEEQIRGVPWGGTAMQTLADIRDGDNQLLDAIRAAADYAVMLEAKHQVDDAFEDYGGTTAKIQRREMNALPPGYEAKQMKPEHPGPHVMAFRDERMREIGTPVGMPLMKIKLDAKGLNFSQAKFGNGNYWRSNEGFQAWLARRVINPLVADVLQESWLEDFATGRAAPAAPVKMSMVWKWPGPPKMDPRIEAMGKTMLRAIGELSMTDMLRDSNKTVEQHAQELARERKVYEEAGVDYPEPSGTLETLKVMAEAILKDQAQAGDDGESTETSEEAEVSLAA